MPSMFENSDRKTRTRVNLDKTDPYTLIADIFYRFEVDFRELNDRVRNLESGPSHERRERRLEEIDSRIDEFVKEIGRFVQPLAEFVTEAAALANRQASVERSILELSREIQALKKSDVSDLGRKR